MGKHLPELIDRYERIPADYRHQTDGEGLTADQRLVASLDAARQALGEIGDKLVQGDRQAFETQGRFIESRYKEGGAREANDGLRSRRPVAAGGRISAAPPQVEGGS